MKNKLRKKAQRTINKYVHALNKNIQKDNLWRGRFVFRQTDSYWEEFEDRSGGILKVVIEARDLKTGKFWEFAMDNYDRGWHLFENANKFIAAGNVLQAVLLGDGGITNLDTSGEYDKVEAMAKAFVQKAQKAAPNGEMYDSLRTIKIYFNHKEKR